ncbi:Gfo/Idh/MocA family protein [Hyphomonas pacifica]|uniref:Gfo/Idh/MocA family protein n=1 Tax=Hyphomonas pacifica TaxID=1280941 RepID=UPI000DD4DB45|nr:Gfo/Idh/MocA family oxidoreductase [Hyphomonas pacifica]
MMHFIQSRRHFMVMTGAGLAAAPWVAGCATAEGAALPAKAIGRPWPDWGELPDSPPPAPKEGSVGVAVVALGGYAIGKVMPALAASDRCHLAAVVSGNPDKAAKVAAAYGLPEDAIYSYDNFDQIAGDDRIEAVYIVLPTGLHAEWTEKAFAAGKHVMCEKPMALSSEECERMIAASEAAGKKLMIGYRCHFEPFNLRAMELMRDGAIGPIRMIDTAHQYMMGPTNVSENWRVVRALAGGGPLEDYGLYSLQAALYLTGEMPVSLKAATKKPANDPRFEQIFSTLTAELTFPSGAVTQLATSYNAPDSKNMIHVEGETGTLHMSPATSYDGQKMTLTRNGVSEDLVPGDPNVQFARMCDHFGQAVREGTTILTPGEMGLRDVRLMEAIYRSAAEGREIRL